MPGSTALRLALLLALPLASRGSPAPPPWGRVVAALQLVAEEYTEALELEDPEAMQRRRAQLAALLEETAPLVPDPALRERLQALRARADGTDYQLSTDCRALIAAIVERTRLERTPRSKPDLARGRRLYSQSCAACHGGDGTGRSSPIAATMDPPPPNIVHPQVNWSPYEMFNRVSWGGAETAMPAFDPGLSARDRWDIVFYLFAVRWPPCAAKPPATLAADELALLGDFELGNRFGYGAAACLRREFLAPARRAASARAQRP